MPNLVTYYSVYRRYTMMKYVIDKTYHIQYSNKNKQAK